MELSKVYPSQGTEKMLKNWKKKRIIGKKGNSIGKSFVFSSTKFFPTIFSTTDKVKIFPGTMLVKKEIS